MCIQSLVKASDIITKNKVCTLHISFRHLCIRVVVPSSGCVSERHGWSAVSGETFIDITRADRAIPC